MVCIAIDLCTDPVLFVSITRYRLWKDVNCVVWA